MDDSFEEQMDISDYEDEEFEIKDATYKALSIDEITDKMEKIIERVISSTEVIGLIELILFFILFKFLAWNWSFQMPATIARIALSQHNWDKDVLLEKFYDDPDKFFEKINVMNPFEEVATTSTASTSVSSGECLTCYEVVPSIVS